MGLQAARRQERPVRVGDPHVWQRGQILRLVRRAVSHVVDSSQFATDWADSTSSALVPSAAWNSAAPRSGKPVGWNRDPAMGRGQPRARCGVNS